MTAVGCSRAPAPSESGKIPVTVSIVPQKYFVERIGGDQVVVNVMVEAGASPAIYEPKPSQIRALSGSAIYFAAGVPFESVWLGRLTRDLHSLRVVNTSEGIEKLKMSAHDHHDHGHEHAHGEETLDPHTWLSPRLVKAQAKTICAALCEFDPAHSRIFRENLDSFLGELDVLHVELQALFDDVESRSFLVFHPSWGYFARDYGLRMHPVEVGGQEPSAAELRVLLNRSREEKIRAILVQPEFSQRSAEIIAKEIGAEIIEASPLSESWPENLRRVAGELRRVLQEPSEP